MPNPDGRGLIDRLRQASGLPLQEVPPDSLRTTLAHHSLDLASHFFAKVAEMAFMKASVLRYWSGLTLVVPCTQMARSLVIWPASMVSITAPSRSVQNSARAGLLSNLALLPSTAGQNHYQCSHFLPSCVADEIPAHVGGREITCCCGCLSTTETCFMQQTSCASCQTNAAPNTECTARTAGPTNRHVVPCHGTQPAPVLQTHLCARPRVQAKMLATGLVLVGLPFWYSRQ